MSEEWPILTLILPQRICYTRASSWTFGREAQDFRDGLTFVKSSDEQIFRNAKLYYYSD